MQIIVRLSKQLFLVALISVGIASIPVRGGEPVVEKNVAPPPPQLFGTGWYAAIDMGANVFQNRGGSRTFTDDFGDTLTIDPKNDVGFFGGLKGGYVFGTGLIRPTLEADFFYNGFRGGADTTLNIDGVVTRGSTSTSFINTGAFMGNVLVRFAFGRFQPYAGAGVGIYYAESAGLDVNTPHGTFSTGGGHNHSDLAWQVIAGTDYYWTPKWSTFIEYHYLNYTSTQIDTNHSRDLGQHLVGAGVRFHF
jgi:opacity protein-like surface antigen